MYCVRCGAALADSEQRCPLCQTRVFHPDLPTPDAPPPYPAHVLPTAARRSVWPMIFFTVFLLLPLGLCVLCDLQLGGGVTWAGYVVGGAACAYCLFLLPLWFRKPNPVIFIPCGAAAVAAYLLYIDLTTGGVHWFVPFALPIVGGLCVIVSAVAALLRYVRRGRLFIFGGAFTLLGLYLPVIEYQATVTFAPLRFMGWSVYPLAFLVMLGAMLLFLGICRPAREAMERKFFL